MAERKARKKDATDLDAFEPVEVASETMAGDLLAAMVDELKTLPDVWQKLPMHKQDEVIWRLRHRVTGAVRQAVRIIASEDRPTLVASVEKVEFKDGVKATLVMSKGNPARHDLADAQGSEVLVVVASAEQHMGGTEGVQPDPDQHDLIDEAA